MAKTTIIQQIDGASVELFLDLEKDFKNYVTEVYPNVSLTEEQQMEIRKAFYAGMVVYRCYIRAAASMTNEAASLQLLTALEQQLTAFVQWIKKLAEESSGNQSKA